MSKRRRLLVEREDAGNYLLISLIAFAATVIIVRLFLELTGYPQVGNSTLHIAHVLWGGLLLFVAVLVALIWDNPSFMILSAVLSGIGMGLFIDEVGKFITQNNDYFFPAAAPIIYGFFLISVLIYFLVRRPEKDDPRRAMVHALEELQDAIYGELDEEEGLDLADNLSIAREAQEPKIAKMASILHAYVEQGNVPFRDYDPGFLRRLIVTVEAWAKRPGRAWHRAVILLGLIITALAALITLGTLIWVALSPLATTQSFFVELAAAAQENSVGNVSAHMIRLILQVAIGVVALLALAFILRGMEARGIVLAVISVVLSLTAVQLITFYLNQFAAVLPTLFQFAFLLVLLSYERWYLNPPTQHVE